jgi:diguanylate cyclase (GGDEF)-like protein
MRLLAGVVAPHLQARRLARLAQTDSLTGLLNRHALENAIPEGAFTQRTLSIALVDLDHFKLVNDRHGHAVGDEALRAVAQELTSAVRTDDRVLRLGGEEFLLALPGASLQAATKLAEGARLRVRDGVRVGDGTVTISVGVAERRPGEPRDVLLARADAALYRAKAQGRDRVVVD